MMKLSPQSHAVVGQLLQGVSVARGKVTIGPLNEAARSLLKLIVAQFDELSALKGEERAARLRDRFLDATKSSSSSEPAPARAARPAIITSAMAPLWRLLHLRCHSIRGIAPPGEDFEFDFQTSSHLLYGPNGSGKSSLLGAIYWVLTGDAVVDAATTVSEAPLYRPAAGSTVGTKIRNWPVIATLPPETDVAKVGVNCWAELLLSRPSDGASVHLRRAYGSQLQASLDGSSWCEVDDLEQIGVTALDLQLSVTAPTIFGRRSIEEAGHTRDILGLMLGFDELDQVGDLASQMSGNRTRLANREAAAISQQVVTLHESLRLLADQLPEGTETASAVTALAQSGALTVGEIDAMAKTLGNAASDAEKHLAEILGLSHQEGKPAGNLSDRLTVAVEQLSKGFSENFPRLGALASSTAFPTDNGLSPNDRLRHLEDAFQAAVSDAQAVIAARYEWWKQETAPGSRAALLLKAAEHFHPATADCPVCERRIENSTLVQRLTELKAYDSHLGAELRTFFEDLANDHRDAVPRPVTDLAAAGVEQRLNDDWQRIRGSLLGEPFATVTKVYDARIAALTVACVLPPVPSLLPHDCDARFRAFAEPYVATVTASAQAIATLKWAQSNLPGLSRALDELITSAESGSLLSQLAKGKHAAQFVKPLVTVSRELFKRKQAQQEIDSRREKLRVLADLEEPLNQLKLLAKYAETAVREEFDAIKDTTSEYLRLMYPESPTRLTAGKLKLGLK